MSAAECAPPLACNGAFPAAGDSCMLPEGGACRRMAAHAQQRSSSYATDDGPARSAASPSGAEPARRLREGLACEVPPSEPQPHDSMDPWLLQPALCPSPHLPSSVRSSAQGGLPTSTLLAQQLHSSPGWPAAGYSSPMFGNHHPHPNTKASASGIPKAPACRGSSGSSSAVAVSLQATFDRVSSPTHSSSSPPSHAHSIRSSCSHLPGAAAVAQAGRAPPTTTLHTPGARTSLSSPDALQRQALLSARKAAASHASTTGKDGRPRFNPYGKCAPPKPAYLSTSTGSGMWAGIASGRPGALSASVASASSACSSSTHTTPAAAAGAAASPASAGKRPLPPWRWSAHGPPRQASASASVSPTTAASARSAAAAAGGGAGMRLLQADALAAVTLTPHARWTPASPHGVGSSSCGGGGSKIPHAPAQPKLLSASCSGPPASASGVPGPPRSRIPALASAATPFSQMAVLSSVGDGGGDSRPATARSSSAGACPGSPTTCTQHLRSPVRLLSSASGHAGVSRYNPSEAGCLSVGGAAGAAGPADDPWVCRGGGAGPSPRQSSSGVRRSSRAGADASSGAWHQDLKMLPLRRLQGTPPPRRVRLTYGMCAEHELDAFGLPQPPPPSRGSTPAPALRPCSSGPLLLARSASARRRGLPLPVRSALCASCEVPVLDVSSAVGANLADGFNERSDDEAGTWSLPLPPPRSVQEQAAVIRASLNLAASTPGASPAPRPPSPAPPHLHLPQAHRASLGLPPKSPASGATGSRGSAAAAAGGGGCSVALAGSSSGGSRWSERAGMESAFVAAHGEAQQAPLEVQAGEAGAVMSAEADGAHTPASAAAAAAEGLSPGPAVEQPGSSSPDLGVREGAQHAEAAGPAAAASWAAAADMPLLQSPPAASPRGEGQELVQPLPSDECQQQQRLSYCAPTPEAAALAAARDEEEEGRRVQERPVGPLAHGSPSGSLSSAAASGDTEERGGSGGGGASAAATPGRRPLERHPSLELLMGKRTTALQELEARTTFSPALSLQPSLDLGLLPQPLAPSSLAPFADGAAPASLADPWVCPAPAPGGAAEVARRRQRRSSALSSGTCDEQRWQSEGGGADGSGGDSRGVSVSGTVSVRASASRFSIEVGPLSTAAIAASARRRVGGVACSEGGGSGSGRGSPPPPWQGEPAQPQEQEQAQQQPAVQDGCLQGQLLADDAMPSPSPSPLRSPHPHTLPAALSEALASSSFAASGPDSVVNSWGSSADMPLLRSMIGIAAEAAAAASSSPPSSPLLLPQSSPGSLAGLGAEAAGMECGGEGKEEEAAGTAPTLRGPAPPAPALPEEAPALELLLLQSPSSASGSGAASVGGSPEQPAEAGGSCERRSRALQEPSPPSASTPQRQHSGSHEEQGASPRAGAGSACTAEPSAVSAEGAEAAAGGEAGTPAAELPAPVEPPEGDGGMEDMVMERFLEQLEAAEAPLEQLEAAEAPLEVMLELVQELEAESPQRLQQQQKEEEEEEEAPAAAAPDAARETAAAGAGSEAQEGPATAAAAGMQEGMAAVAVEDEDLEVLSLGPSFAAMPSLAAMLVPPPPACSSGGFILSPFAHLLVQQEEHYEEAEEETAAREPLRGAAPPAAPSQRCPAAAVACVGVVAHALEDDDWSVSSGMSTPAQRHSSGGGRPATVTPGAPPAADPAAGAGVCPEHSLASCPSFFQLTDEASAGVLHPDPDADLDDDDDAGLDPGLALQLSFAGEPSFGAALGGGAPAASRQPACLAAPQLPLLPLALLLQGRGEEGAAAAPPAASLEPQQEQRPLASREASFSLLPGPAAVACGAHNGEAHHRCRKDEEGDDDAGARLQELAELAQLMGMEPQAALGPHVRLQARLLELQPAIEAAAAAAASAAEVVRSAASSAGCTPRGPCTPRVRSSVAVATAVTAASRPACRELHGLAAEALGAANESLSGAAGTVAGMRPTMDRASAALAYAEGLLASLAMTASQQQQAALAGAQQRLGAVAEREEGSSGGSGSDDSAAP